MIREEGKVQLFLEIFTLEKNDDTAEKVEKGKKYTERNNSDSLPAHGARQGKDKGSRDEK